MANKPVATVTSSNTARTVEVTQRPSGNLSGKCSDTRCEPMQPGDVMQSAREHLRWQHR